jgi:hypothetical protein
MIDPYNVDTDDDDLTLDGRLLRDRLRGGPGDMQVPGQPAPPAYGPQVMAGTPRPDGQEPGQGRAPMAQRRGAAGVGSGYGQGGGNSSVHAAALERGRQAYGESPTAGPTSPAGEFGPIGGGQFPGATPPQAGGTPSTEQPAAAEGGFQSTNMSPSGYAQEYVASIVDQIRAVPIGPGGDESARRAVTEDLIRQMIPGLQARGVNVQDVRNEKILVDGQWIDLIRDVSGVAEPQWMVVDEGAAGAAQGAPAGVASAGSAAGSAQSLVPTDQSTYQQYLQRLLQQAGGSDAFDREALLAQMSR